MWVPPAMGARWHLGADRCFSPVPAPSFQNSFPILCPLPSRRLSLESQLRHPIVLGWPLAGGWRPAAAVLAAAGSEPGLRAQGQRESSSVYLVLRLQPERMLSLLFSPSFFIFFFFPLPAVRGAFCSGTPSQPHPAAVSYWDSPPRRKAERKAEGARDAIACHLISLIDSPLFTALPRHGWASPADPAV